MVSAEVIKAVRDYLHELSGKGIFISKCFIYGSQTKDTATEDSDIDLMIISPLFDEDTEKYLPAIWLSAIRTEHRIEPLAIGEQRFQTDETSPIIEVVRQEGIEIAA
jgi:DNA polymerase sigma